MAEGRAPDALFRLDTRAAKRPLGIWLLTALYVCLSAWSIWEKVGLLLVRDGTWWQSHRASIYGPGDIELSLAFSIVLLATAIAVFLRARIARYVLLALLALAVVELVIFTYQLSSLDSRSPAALTNPSEWWKFLSWPLGVLLWLLVNAWYLFGSRTQAFFRVTRDQLRTGHA